jgi:hypothetical protein
MRYGIWSLILVGDMFAEITEYWHGTWIDAKTMAAKENVRIFTIGRVLFVRKHRSLIQTS